MACRRIKLLTPAAHRLLAQAGPEIHRQKHRASDRCLPDERDRQSRSTGSTADSIVRAARGHIESGCTQRVRSPPAPERMRPECIDTRVAAISGILFSPTVEWLP